MSTVCPLIDLQGERGELVLFIEDSHSTEESPMIDSWMEGLGFKGFWV